MQYCDNCGSELPVRSHFCGTCGHLLGNETNGASDVTRLSQPDLPALDTPSLFKNPFHPPIDYAQLEQSDAGATIQHDWSKLDERSQLYIMSIPIRNITINCMPQYHLLIELTFHI